MLVLLARHLFCDVVGFLAFGFKTKIWAMLGGRLPSDVPATPPELPSRPRPPRHLIDDHFA